MTAPPSIAHRGRAFRPDIEGVRAIAVLAVLAYHARIPGIPGGYVGVDVFFVVSGFLISGLIIRELRTTGTVSLPNFYARRARRLLPAALVVIFATVLASVVLLPPLRVADVAQDGAATALYIGNIRFAAQATDYLQAELDPSPLLHFWSLGVEEQFYLFWPALLLLVAGRGADPRRLGLAIAVVAVVSLALSIAWTQTDAPLAFFLLPTRAWELAVGAAIALTATRISEIPGWTATVMVAAGVGLIAWASITFDLATPFPGTAAIVPVAGAALIIAGGMPQPRGPLSNLLAIAPMQWIGGISYSLYLWHWPLLVLPAAAIGAPLPDPVRLGLVGMTFLLAMASQRWIEDPIRYGRLSLLRTSRTLGAAGALSLTVAAASLGLGAVTGPPAPVQAITEPVDVGLPTPSVSPAASAGVSPGTTPGMSPAATPAAPATTPPGPVPADLVPALSAVRDDIPIVYADGCHAESVQIEPGRCVYGAVDASTTVVLIGDSHAAQWFPTLDRLARKHGWRLVSLTKSACPAADVAVYHTSLKREYTECASWRTATLERIETDRPAVVVISNSRTGQLWVDGAAVESTTRDDLWAAGLARTVRAVQASAGAVVVIGDTPNPAGDPPACLSDHLDDVLACATPVEVAVDPVRMATERQVAERYGATFVEPTGWLCPTEPCPAVIGRLLVYRDGHHMTTPFAHALAPLLDPLLPPVAP